MLSCLSHNTISSSYNEDSTIHLSSTSDHVLYIVSMAWAVNVCIVTLVCFILNVSCVNCDTTLSLFRSLIDVSVINEISIAFEVENLCDSSSKCCFTMVNVADCTNVNMGLISFKFFSCHWKFPPYCCKKNLQ